MTSDRHRGRKQHVDASIAANPHRGASEPQDASSAAHRPERGAVDSPQDASNAPASDLPEDTPNAAQTHAVGTSHHDASQKIVHSWILADPTPATDKPAYGRLGGLVLAAFVAYHLIALLHHLFPRNGLALRFSRTLNAYTQMEPYIKRSTHTQGWRMFAPNPIRLNEFTRIFSEDTQGTVWDLKHDIYGRRAFPYLFYDRGGKLNRRLMGKHQRWQLVYAAWVCREGERRALREQTPLPQRIHFVKLWNRIPPPRYAFATGGYDPMRLRINRSLTGVYDCTQIPDGRLTNIQRLRAGLPTVDDQSFEVTPSRTWFERRQAEAKLAETEAEDTEHQDSEAEGGEGL